MLCQFHNLASSCTQMLVDYKTFEKDIVWDIHLICSLHFWNASKVMCVSVCQAKYFNGFFCLFLRPWKWDLSCTWLFLGACEMLRILYDSKIHWAVQFHTSFSDLALTSDLLLAFGPSCDVLCTVPPIGLKGTSWHLAGFLTFEAVDNSMLWVRKKKKRRKKSGASPVASDHSIWPFFVKAVVRDAQRWCFPSLPLCVSVMVWKYNYCHCCKLWRVKGSFKRACQQSCDHSIVLKLAKKVYRFALSFWFFSFCLHYFTRTVQS